MKSMPRSVTAAANPTRSPITPPPKATTTERRSTPKARNSSTTCSRNDQLLVLSPAGRTRLRLAMPARSRAATSRAGCAVRARFSSVTTTVRRNGTNGASSSPARSISPAPMAIGIAALAQRHPQGTRFAHQTRRAEGSTIAIIRSTTDFVGLDLRIDRVVGLGVDRIALLHQRRQDLVRVAALEQRAGAALAGGAGDQRLEIGAEPDRDRPRRDPGARLRVDEGAAAQRQHHGPAFEQAGDHPTLQLAKARLAVECEDVGDAEPGGGHDLVVGVGEGCSQRPGEPPTDRSLAGTHQAHQHDGALQPPRRGAIGRLVGRGGGQGHRARR